MIRGLHARLTLVLTALLLVLGALAVWAATYAARAYHREITQRQERDLASMLVADARLMEGDALDLARLGALAKTLAMTNPGVEVYVLGEDGAVLAAGAPERPLAEARVPLEPVRRALRPDADLPLLGLDPRRGGRTVFSVAPLPGAGYLYVVLTSDELAGIAQAAQASTVLRATLAAAVATVVLALAGGALAFGLLTRRLRRLRAAMSAFRAADFRGGSPLPPPARGGDEIDELRAVFVAMADRISAQLEQLEAADRQRRELVGNVSHDLRTPLAALQGYLETLELRDDRLGAEERRAFLTAARRHGRRLEALIGQLAELARLDGAASPLRRELFPPAELLHDVVHGFRARADEAGVALEVSAPSALPALEGDIGLIERALTNLLDNALRHTGPGGRVRLGATRRGDRLRIEVEDSGEGMSEAVAARAFERFYRGAPERGGPGTGLGLAIVRRVAELHGGEVSVATAPGEGARFVLELPAAPPG